MAAVFTSDPLLLDLYGCSAAPDRWAAMLDRLCSSVGARSALLQGIELDAGRFGRTFWCAHDSSTDLNAYERIISDARNPRLQDRRLSDSIGMGLGDDGHIFQSAQDLPRKQWLHDRLSHLGLGRFLGALMPLGEGRCVALVLHRHVRDAEIDFPRAVRARLTELLPHIAQAVSLGQTMVRDEGLEAVMRDCLDRWHGGLLVCDNAGRVQWMNRLARQRLASGAPLRVRDGVLHAHGVQDLRLKAALASRRAEATDPSFLALDHEGRRLHLALLPLSQGLAGSAVSRGVLVSLSDGQLLGQIPSSALSALFGLTDAEARLTGALVQGGTLEQYAQRRGVSVGTVRYQLKQVLAKTGAGRQSDLVRTVLCSVAAHAAGFGVCTHEPVAMH